MNGSDEIGTEFADVYVARAMKTAAGDDVRFPVNVGHAECFTLHRIRWHATRISTDGRRMIWHFRAPDAESVRLALRRAGIAFDEVWVEPRAATTGPD